MRSMTLHAMISLNKAISCKNLKFFNVYKLVITFVNAFKKFRLLHVNNLCFETKRMSFVLIFILNSNFFIFFTFLICLFGIFVVSFRKMNERNSCAWSQFMDIAFIFWLHWSCIKLWNDMQFGRSLQFERNLELSNRIYSSVNL